MVKISPYSNLVIFIFYYAVMLLMAYPRITIITILRAYQSTFESRVTENMYRRTEKPTSRTVYIIGERNTRCRGDRRRSSWWEFSQMKIIIKRPFKNCARLLLYSNLVLFRHVSRFYVSFAKGESPIHIIKKGCDYGTA